VVGIGATFAVNFLFPARKLDVGADLDEVALGGKKGLSSADWECVSQELGRVAMLNRVSKRMRSVTKYLPPTRARTQTGSKPDTGTPGTEHACA
jgi:hypothetical protein